MPIVAKYCRALKCAQDRATKDGDLDSALAYRNEREKIESEHSNALSSEAGEPEGLHQSLGRERLLRLV